MVALTGTGRLADDIYLLAHHEVSDKPFAHPEPAVSSMNGFSGSALTCAS
jgi:hypothetical protein